MKKITLLILTMFPLLFLVSCKKNNNYEDETYNIVVANATIPPMMSVLDAIDNGNKTIMWYGRPNTFYSTEGLKDQFSFTNKVDQEEISGIPGDVISEIKNKVLDIYYQSKEKAKFNLYVVDYGIKVPLQIFVENNIKEENYKVFLLEDGTGSYEQFINVDKFAQEDGKKRFDEALNKLDTLIEDVKKGNYKWENLGNERNWEYSYAYATKSNVEYWLQYPEALTSKDEEMQKLLDNKTINFKKQKLTSMFDKLSKENKEKFKNVILDIDKFDSMINLNNGKDVLIVTGTSYDGEEIGFVDGKKGDLELEFVMDKIIEQYGETHNILFKPHPAWMPSLGDDMGVRWETVLGKDRPDEWHKILKSRVEYFENNNITVLPGQTPIEAILWAYPNVKIGGYNSSLYMNASETQVQFFILAENDYNKLSNPLSVIIANGGLKNPETNENPFIIYPGLYN